LFYAVLKHLTVRFYCSGEKYAGVWVFTQIGVYFFGKKSDQNHYTAEIRKEFIQERVSFGKEFGINIFTLKQATRNLILTKGENKYSVEYCTQIRKELKIDKNEDILIEHAFNLDYLFGSIIRAEFKEFIAWFDLNKITCFQNIQNPEPVLNNKIYSLQYKMWGKLYPPHIIKDM
jgi:hypothetical protein